MRPWLKIAAPQARDSPSDGGPQQREPQQIFLGLLFGSICTWVGQQQRMDKGVDKKSAQVDW
eukprot:CAMPEP_0206469072 /NCGR_PEP_ID=MMETSP0324_2-20121206/30032_1 /ASSEMBLY_ACC=CAM_ASM_000836 /TAXON_ID=2866 /ORGANISM="Crypthecodinium cohnii, Strain Seligo" /LENGTH=61 /DNA_ID=CAMNT_0053942701 /DNA_START=68 /DNA_END=253 /DNA_ORIENTATION=-